MEFIKAWLAIVDGPGLVILMALIAVDTLAGILVALKTHTFQWCYLSNFVKTDVLFQVGGYLLTGLAAAIIPASFPGVLVSWAAIDASLIASIGAKVKALNISISVSKPPPAKPTGSIP